VERVEKIARIGAPGFELRFDVLDRAEFADEGLEAIAKGAAQVLLIERPHVEPRVFECNAEERARLSACTCRTTAGPSKKTCSLERITSMALVREPLARRFMPPTIVATQTPTIVLFGALG
jgi:hypothetical protein